MISNWNSLNVLSLTECYEISPNSLETVITEILYSSLQQLYVDPNLVCCESLTNIVSVCTQLEICEILGYPYNTLQLTSNSLQTLDISQDDTENFIETIQLNVSTLHTLHLGFCPNLIELNCNVSNLTTFHCWSRLLSSQSLQQGLISSCKDTLTSLNLGYMSITDEELIQLLLPLKQLNSFEIHWNPILNVLNFPYNVKQTLTNLVIEGLKIDSCNIAELLFDLTQLTNLHVSSCPFIDLNESDFYDYVKRNRNADDGDYAKLHYEYSRMRCNWTPEQFSARCFQYANAGTTEWNIEQQQIEEGEDEENEFEEGW